MSGVSGHCTVWIPSLLESLMDIKWVPGRRPSAIQAMVIHKHGDWSLFWTYVYKMLLLRLISMIKRILMIFLVQSIILIYYFNWDKLRNNALTGRESSPKKPISSYYPPGSDQYSRPGPRQVPVVSSGCGLCLGGTKLITDLSAQQRLSADARGSFWFIWQWEKELALPEGQSCTTLCRALVFVEQPSLCLSLPSPRARLTNLERLLESLRNPFGNWKLLEPVVTLQVRGIRVGQLAVLFIQVLMNEFSYSRRRAVSCGKKTKEPHTTQVITDSRWAGWTRPARVTGRKWGQGHKQKWHWPAARRKRGSPKGICTGLKPCSVSMGRMAFSGNLAILNSLQGAEIHTGLLCWGRTRRKSGCWQTPHHKQPWQRGGMFIKPQHEAGK